MTWQTTRYARSMAWKVRTAACVRPVDEARIHEVRDVIWSSLRLDSAPTEIHIKTSHRTRQPPVWEHLLCTTIARTFEVGVRFTPGQCVRQGTVGRPQRGVVAFMGQAELVDLAAATYVTLRQQMLRDLNSQDKRSSASNWRMRWVNEVAVHLLGVGRPRNSPHIRNEHRHSAGNRR